MVVCKNGGESIDEDYVYRLLVDGVFLFTNFNGFVLETTLYHLKRCDLDHQHLYSDNSREPNGCFVFVTHDRQYRIMVWRRGGGGGGVRRRRKRKWHANIL